MKKFIAILGISTMAVSAGLLTTTSFDHTSNSVDSAFAPIVSPMEHDAHSQ